MIRPREYTVGFMFDAQRRVILLRKNRPAWQSGRLNGVGGKVEEGEKPYGAMVREFSEEAGFFHPHWNHVTTMEGYEQDGELWHVHIFKAFVDRFPDDLGSESDVGEKIEIHDGNNVPTDVIPNLKWIIPLCLETNLELVGIR